MGIPLAIHNEGAKLEAIRKEFLRVHSFRSSAFNPLGPRRYIAVKIGCEEVAEVARIVTSAVDQG